MGGDAVQGELFIGTSGYSYDDWRGPFYPEKMKSQDMLAFYAREFPFVEINQTYYRLPTERNLMGMAEKVPAGFVFTVKAYQSLTHDRQTSVKEDATVFRQAAKVLAEEGKLGAVLLQFPYSFHNDGVGRAYIAYLRELLPDLPLVAEVRHCTWDSPETPKQEELN